MRQARTLHANLRQPNDSISILPLGGKINIFLVIMIVSWKQKATTN